MAGSDSAHLAIAFHRDIDTAHPAGSKGIEVGCVAQRGNDVFPLVTAEKSEDGLPCFDRKWIAVDIGYILIAIGMAVFAVRGA
jgi:hypothetical protein